MPGHFITFEGIEGSGKSTQLAILSKRLRGEGYRVVETREPGGTAVAEEIRRLLLDGASSRSAGQVMVPECEAALVFASRAQHVAEVIIPALKTGAVVLCDRFIDSTLAYQGYGRGLDLRQLRMLNQFASRGVEPDLTLLFDVPVPTGLARRRRDTSGQNRLDRETRAFHARVKAGYLALARRERTRIRIIDADRPPDRIAVEVIQMVQGVLAQTAPRRHRRARGHGMKERR